MPVGATVSTLNTVESAISWAGSFRDIGAVSAPELYAEPSSCERVPCRSFLLDVELPTGAWADSPGGIQIAIDWAPREENDLDLYVYSQDGRLVGESDGVFASTGESVRLRKAPNGLYRIVIVPRLVIGTMSYRGFAEVEREADRNPIRALLPNLVALPARNPHLRTGAYFADPQAGGTPSCYPEEVAEQGARRCLRFDQVVANFGEGPFELRYRIEGMSRDQQLRQRIYLSDGSFTDTAVDTYEFHPVHAHFHYKNFAQAFLYRIQDDGSLQEIRQSRKNGFCMIDVENRRFGSDATGRPYKGESPRTYYFPRCNVPSEHDGRGAAMVNGISVGWADVYNWFLADQYIEISGVPDGTYVLKTVANPSHTVHETTEQDNVAQVRIHLHADRVEIVP